MRKMRRYTEKEKQQIVEEVKATGNIAQVAKKNNVPAGTIQTWIKPKYRKITNNVDNNIEIKNLKSKLNDAELENKILKELLKKTYQVWPTN